MKPILRFQLPELLEWTQPLSRKDMMLLVKTTGEAYQYKLNSNIFNNLDLIVLKFDPNQIYDYDINKEYPIVIKNNKSILADLDLKGFLYVTGNKKISFSYQHENLAVVLVSTWNGNNDDCKVLGGITLQELKDSNIQQDVATIIIYNSHPDFNIFNDLFSDANIDKFNTVTYCVNDKKVKYDSDSVIFSLNGGKRFTRSRDLILTIFNNWKSEFPFKVSQI